MKYITDPRLEQLEQQVHVWLTVPEEISDPHTLSEYFSLLSEDERERQQRFHFEKDRHSFLVSHALVRKVLSKYIDIDPCEWQFASGEYGRPEISSPACMPHLRFNLTHTDGLTACLVTLDTDCGVDAERIDGQRDLRAIAEKMFASSELETLRPLVGRQYQQQFYSFWTLHEAYCKALGTGLGFSKKDYAFKVASDDEISINIDSHGGDEIKEWLWQFSLLRPAVDHLVAIAVRKNGVSAKSVLQQFIVP